ncbi:hypothetical protein OF83DRAFT_1051986 [Amylostereum chailletii]|nr:hypothetical protein OF83DRAFT_1051986 [Amylostereum chailletii]
MARHVSLLPIAPHRMRIPEVMEITLTDVEEQLCTLLDDCTKHVSEVKGIRTSCRIAGGWVRDKVSRLVHIPLIEV